MAMDFDFELLQKDFAYFRKDSNYTESDVKNSVSNFRRP